VSKTIWSRSEGGLAVKEIVAIVRINKMNQTKQALADAGFAAFNATKVLGRGRGQVDFRLLRGAAAGAEEAIAMLGRGPQLIPKRMINLVVSDEEVPLVIQTLLETNSTGRAGDGKIFVLPVDDSVRIRTGESGIPAVDGDRP
jgi:nitrogen regulatory protein PII 2